MKRAVLLLVLIAPASAGCRATDERAAADASGVPIAQCPVCAAEGDLACVDVKVRPDTPSTQYQGRTYWFCSQECREDFEKDPEHYLGR